MYKIGQKKKFFISLLTAVAVSAITAGAVYGIASASHATTSQVSKVNVAEVSASSFKAIDRSDIGTGVIPGVGTLKNISLANLPNLPQGLSTSTYAIDLVSNAQLCVNFLDYIVKNPTRFFETVPQNPTGESDATIINPENAQFTISADGSSVIISVYYLTHYHPIFGYGEYAPTNLLVTGFNTTPTTIANSIDATGFSIGAPSTLTPTSPSLLSFLRSPQIVNTIFRNAPQALINNPQNIIVNSLSFPDDLKGEITANITASNALVPVVGFKDITGDILITGINTSNSNLPSITNTEINVNSLPSDIINSSMYSLDAYNRVNSSNSVLVNYMNRNPELFITNPILNAGVDQFTNVSFSYTGDSIVMNCSYLYQYAANSTIYVPATLTFTGFNTQSTAINPTVSENGLNLSTYFYNVLPSSVAADASHLNILKNQISNRIASIFVNYPNSFINDTKNSINSGLTVLSPNDVEGTLSVNIPTVNAFSNGSYTNASFTVKVTGFASEAATPTPDIPVDGLDIGNLAIPGIDSSVFSVDVRNSQELQQTIQSFMIANPQLFLTNPIVGNNQSTSPSFKDFTFRHNYSDASELYIDCQYLSKYDTSTQVGEYSPVTFKLFGFNKTPTTINSGFTPNASTGFYLQGFNRISSSDLEGNLSTYKARIEEQLNSQRSLLLQNAPISTINNSRIIVTGIVSTNSYRGEAIFNVEVSNAIVSGMYGNLTTQIKCSGFQSSLINSSNTTLKNIDLNANTNLSFFEEVFSGKTTGGTQTNLSKGYINDWKNANANELAIAANNLKDYINTHIDIFFNNPLNTRVSNATITQVTNTQFVVGLEFNGLLAGNANSNIVNPNAFEIILRQSPNAAVLTNDVQNQLQQSLDKLADTYNKDLTVEQLYNFIANVLNDLKLPDAWYPQSGSFTVNDIRNLLGNLDVSSSEIQIPSFTIGIYPDQITIEGMTIKNPLFKPSNSSTNQCKPSSSNDDQWIIWLCIGLVSGVALLALVAFILWWNWDSIAGGVRRSGSSEDYSEYYDDYFDDSF